MARATTSSALEQIGEAAGAVWRHLHEKGPVSITALVKEIDAPRDVIMQALGWLAREDKVALEENARSKTVSLKTEM